MASYQDLLDAIARVGAATGDADAWMAGLSGDDLAVVSTPVSVIAPGAIDNVLARIRARHAAVFDVPAPEGSAAEAIRTAETSLAQQNSLSAQVDLQVITAVLNAHATPAAGRSALDDLKTDFAAFDFQPVQRFRDLVAQPAHHVLAHRRRLVRQMFLHRAEVFLDAPLRCPAPLHDSDSFPFSDFNCSKAFVNIGQ